MQEIDNLDVDTFINTPFMLQIVQQSLPTLLQKANAEKQRLQRQTEQQGQGELRKGGAAAKTTQKITTTRAQLYEVFTGEHFKREQQKIEKNPHFVIPDKYDIAASAKEFSEDLAIHMFVNDVVSVQTESVNYRSHRNQSNDKDFERFFDSKETKTYIARKASQLIELDGQCRFSHKSIMEYFAASMFYQDFNFIILTFKDIVNKQQQTQQSKQQKKRQPSQLLTH